MITHLRAKNFKSWADTGDLRIAPLTGFFGTNSSGKTSLLQLLLLMKQTAESNDRRQVLNLGDRNSLIDLGTFQDILHGHKNDKGIQIDLNWRPAYVEQDDLGFPNSVFDVLWGVELQANRERVFPSEDASSQGLNGKQLNEIREKVKQQNEIKLESSINIEANRIILDSFQYRLGDYIFGQKKSQEVGSKSQYQLIAKNFQLEVPFFDEEDYSNIEVTPVKFYGFPHEFGYEYPEASVFSELEFFLEQELKNVVYLGPLREYPQRTYIWSGAAPSTVGTRGENAVAALLAAQTENRPIDAKIAEWLKKMGLIHSFKLEPIAFGRRDYEVRIRKTPNSAEVLITDVGFGVSQLLPVLVLCYYVPEGSIIILEQPEIHLHPSVQSDLADLLIDVVKDRKVQIIFESHSEHLLRRLQRRIAEEKISPD